MARVSQGEVKRIISTTEDIQPQIEAANVLVTEKLGGDTTITAKHLKVIEAWVAAHFVACSTERQAGKEKIGDTMVEYVGAANRDTSGLNLTSYGQQAVLLDTTGTLSALGRRKARVDTIDAIDMS